MSRNKFNKTKTKNKTTKNWYVYRSHSSSSRWKRIIIIAIVGIVWQHRMLRVTDKQLLHCMYVCYQLLIINQCVFGERGGRGRLWVGVI